jgi:large subunit ribosomal protein L32
MPVPKKRVGHSEQGHRRSCWKATVPTMNQCDYCGAAKHSHMACGVCGTYKGRVVLHKVHARFIAAAEEREA